MRGVKIMKIQITPGLNPQHPIHYTSKVTPHTYKCGCGLTGVKLYRPQNASTMHCFSCLSKSFPQLDSIIYGIGEKPKAMDLEGIHFVPAIPTTQNDAFWEHQSIPKDAAEWWLGLPSPYIDDSKKEELLCL